LIATLDIGSSSIRALLFDSEARQLEGYGARLPYQPDTTPDGGVEIDPERLANLVIDCLDELHRQVQSAKLKVAAVGGCGFWHSFLGVGENGRPALPILHLLDTRSASEVSRVPDAHARTGCFAHSSYWPAKLLWLAKNRAAEYAATRFWLSFPEFLFFKLFGRAHASTSMVSATGLWDQNANDYDDDMLAHLQIDRRMLARPESLDQPARDLLPEFASAWPAFDRIPWYPMLGDGACDSAGCGAIGPRRFSLMVGTTGAMRAIIEAPKIDIAPGLWCYRLDRKRFVTGGALSDGGDVYAWMKRTLALPKDLESKLESTAPGGHGLTVLPFFSGERSPHWRGDVRGAIAGIRLATEPFDIFRASLESVALGFREIYQILIQSLGVPTEVFASGGALLHSPAWTQMMADSLARPVTASTEPEAASRGAALWTLEQTGAIPSITDLAASTGAVFTPRAEYEPVYHRLLADQHELYTRLYGRPS
jgi:gluconokinase